MTATAASTLSRFPAAAEAFVRDLYVEHLEEAAFLYDQRNFMLENIEMEPHDIAWNEQRCDRHLDALVAGGDVTLAMCTERAAAGEEGGELYAALRVFCRANRPDLVKNVLDELDTEDTVLMAAARDGMKHELPKSWSAQVSQWLDEADEARAAILAVASAYRQLDVGPAIVLNASGPLANPVPFLWALGQLRESTAALLFQKYLTDDDDDARQAAAIGALRCGDSQVAGVLRSAVARGEAWAAVPLSLVGAGADFATLERLASKAIASPQVAIALGLLGQPSATDILLSWLASVDVSENAALSLHLLTGAYPLEPDWDAEPSPRDTDDASEVDVHADTALARSRTAWESPCKALALVAKEGTQVLFGSSDLATRALHGLESPRLPIRVRNLLSDALLIGHGIHAAPCDAWDLRGKLRRDAKATEGKTDGAR